MVNALNWEPDGVTLQVRFCEEPGNEAAHGQNIVAPPGNQAETEKTNLDLNADKFPAYSPVRFNF